MTLRDLSLGSAGRRKLSRMEGKWTGLEAGYAPTVLGDLGQDPTLSRFRYNGRSNCGAQDSSDNLLEAGSRWHYNKRDSFKIHIPRSPGHLVH